MNKLSSFVAALFLTILFALSFLSSWNDSAIFDETAHIGAAYSYVTQKDMRLNPEHPPLLKDLSGIAMLFINPQPAFRTDTDYWQKEINGQWTQGGAFLYEFGNNPDVILHYARFPIMILAIILGALLFVWVRGLYGNKTALLTLFLYSFSPTIIAHSRFVTTDIAASFAFFIGIVSFIKFLRTPNRKHILIAGLCFGIAQLLKFSLVLLVPIFAVLGFMWLITDEELFNTLTPAKERRKIFWHKARTLILQTFLIFIIGGVLIWGVYIWHVWDYPEAKQLADAESLIGGFKVHFITSIDLWLIQHPLTRPLGQYLFGVMMVTQRTAGGNTAYFMGEVSSKGWLAYFPTAYLLKETLALHILSIIALLAACARVARAREKSWRALSGWIHDNFAVFASLFFVGFYWFSSIINPLNIGIRHVLPTFPFIYFLVARQIVLWTGRPPLADPTSIKEYIVYIFRSLIMPIPKLLLVVVLCAWIAISTLANFPYYLSYFNELVGGTANGHWYITDSNYDWGQDLKRLADIAHQNPGLTIYLDYFGGGRPSYYLGNQYIPWYSSFGPPPKGSIFAVSANSIRGNQAHYNPSVKPPETRDTYPWLHDLAPFARAGTSIFLYRIP